MIAVAASCIVFVLSWWLTKRLCAQKSLFHLLDHPNERSLHETPTPRTGGLAVLASAACGFAMTSLITLWDQGGNASLLNSTGSRILWATLALAAVSFCDDRWGLPTGFRFALQIMVAFAVVIGGGLVLDSVWVPFHGNLDLGWAAKPVTVLFLVWMTNLYNFMDGMDGFAGGMTVLGFAFLSYFGWQAGHLFVFVTALVISAGAAGFLFHNFPPAHIFMGDVGSVPIGFLCGALAILGCRDGIFDVWVPLILFSPFVVDATMTLVRRIAQREKVWEAHRTHYYQRLVLAGWGHRRTVLLEYGLMLMCGALAVLYHLGHDWQQRAGVLIAWATVYVVLILGVQLVERRIVS